VSAGWFILIVLIVLAVAGTVVLHWLKHHCPLCNTRWQPSGQKKPGGSAGRRSAEMVEWRCPSCGHVEWVKTNWGGLW